MANSAWLFTLVPRSGDVGELMKDEIESIMQSEGDLRRVQVYPARD